MNSEKIAKLKALGDIGVSGAEIAEVKEKLAAGNSVCTTICAWVIRKAAGYSSCAAGEAALVGIFTLAEGVFFPEGEEILVPLEEVVCEAWGATCAEIGIAALGRDAEKYAREWCSQI